MAYMGQSKFRSIDGVVCASSDCVDAQAQTQ